MVIILLYHLFIGRIKKLLIVHLIIKPPKETQTRLLKFMCVYVLVAWERMFKL